MNRMQSSKLEYAVFCTIHLAIKHLDAYQERLFVAHVGRRRVLVYCKQQWVDSSSKTY
jgi:hypothetical protein